MSGKSYISSALEIISQKMTTGIIFMLKFILWLTVLLLIYSSARTAMKLCEKCQINSSRFLAVCQKTHMVSEMWGFPNMSRPDL